MKQYKPYSLWNVTNTWNNSIMGKQLYFFITRVIYFSVTYTSKERYSPDQQNRHCLIWKLPFEKKNVHLVYLSQSPGIASKQFIRVVLASAAAVMMTLHQRHRGLETRAQWKQECWKWRILSCCQMLNDKHQDFANQGLAHNSR